MSTCSVAGCRSRSSKRGLCNAHYIRQRRYGSTEKSNHARPVAERFWSKVSKGAGCWEWTGSTSGLGYGQLATRAGDPPARAHRLSWELHRSPVPDGLFVCHRCDNPRCVRPDHLFLGTPAENAADMAHKGRASRGEKQWHSKLTIEDIVEIRRRHVAGELQQALADAFGVAPNTVSRIVNRMRWRHVA